SSTPLTSDELEALSAPPGGVVLVRGGFASVHVPPLDHREDPATWLDVTDFRLAEVSTLGGPLAPAVDAAEAVNPDVRRRLGSPPVPSGSAGARRNTSAG